MAKIQSTNNPINSMYKYGPIRIVSPTIGFPTIQSPGNHFLVYLNTEPGLPVEPANCVVELCKGERRITFTGESTVDHGSKYFWTAYLPIEKVTHITDCLYCAVVKVPNKTHEGLYDLKITVAQKSFIQENSVQILKTLSQQPKFCLLADTHIGFKGYPCINEPNIDEISIAAHAIKQVNYIHPDLVIIIGDLVDWSSKGNWRDFINLLKLFEVPVYTVVGNHDYYWDNWWIGYPPLLPAPTRCDPVALRHYIKYVNPYLSYSFDYGSYHITCLDSGEDAVLTPVEAYGSGLSDEDMEWLKTELKDHQQNFIFMHHPVTRTDANDALKPDNQIGCITKNRVEFMELCSQNNVVAVFSGHEHKTECWHTGKVNYHILPSLTRSHEENAFLFVFTKSNGNYHTELFNCNPSKWKEPAVGLFLPTEPVPELSF